jgi:hypothetical protein
MFSVFIFEILAAFSFADNSGGKCHIFHQLMAICKDMAETIITLDKSLKESQLKFLEEDKNVYLELFKTEEDLISASKFDHGGVDLFRYSIRLLIIVYFAS